MAEMSAGFANCLSGQPRVKPPCNPSAGQSAGFAGADWRCAKATVPVHTRPANAAAIPTAFRFIIQCPPVIAGWKDVIISPCCIRLSAHNPDCCVAGPVRDRAGVWIKMLGNTQAPCFGLGRHFAYPNRRGGSWHPADCGCEADLVEWAARREILPEPTPGRLSNQRSAIRAGVQSVLATCNDGIVLSLCVRVQFGR